MYYQELPEGKYIYYECFRDKNDNFTYLENDDPLVRSLFLTSKVIPISRYIPHCFHSYILRYYYGRQ
jgi:hypothetical protein